MRELWLTAGAGALVALLIGTIFYRLFLHPLAKFPGPKLAAISTLYEGYYDVVHQGRYLWQIEKLHKQYGMSFSFAYPLRPLSALCAVIHPPFFPLSSSSNGIRLQGV